MTLHAMMLTNVGMTDNLRIKAKNTGLLVSAHHQIEPVIYKLATMYPMWTFTATTNGYSSDAGKQIHCTDFEVSCDGEQLGKIFRRYEGRDYHICVQNDRIAKSMERSPYFYKTKDPAKAVAKVKKYFSPKNHTERLTEARKAATDVARDADWSKTRVLREARDKIENAARDYVLHDGFEVFMQFVKERAPSKYDELVKSRETVMETEHELSTITSVQNILVSKDTGAMITRSGADYIVQFSGKTVPEVYNDQTLPEWMRAGLGMLKLIEPGQFITETGMRATSDTFVLIGEDLTNVSQGESE